METENKPRQSPLQTSLLQNPAEMAGSFFAESFLRENRGRSPALRLGTPPEVTVLTLRRKQNRPAWQPAGRKRGERHAAAPGRYLPASRLCFLL